MPRSSPPTPPPAPPRSGIALVAGWAFGAIAALAILLNVIAGSNVDAAIAHLALLLFLPVFWGAPWPEMSATGWRTRLEAILSERPQQDESGNWQWATRATWLLALFTGGVSFGMSAWVGTEFGDLPPAYHDEYSYLFQAETFLAGRVASPTHPTHPELFDQMHVLNDGGSFASRYFPATGVWIAPFLAMGHPYWGHWIAGALSAVCVFWSGRELANTGVGLLAGLLLAIAPGVILFSNLLLAHHPALLGLTGFLWAFLRLMRRRHVAAALTAGACLAFAMLARPMTAAGFALPCGILLLVWAIRGDIEADTPPRSRRLLLMSLVGLPILIGLLGLGVYNHSVTGSAMITPYQRYTDVYTPRHVYGFNNVVRGEQRLGPKVIDNYDRWAENLTPQLAAENTLTRWLVSWQWILGIVPLGMGLLMFLIIGGPRSRLEWLIPASILSLHLAHVPYWFVGIMGWHYVFETAPLWTLLFALATRHMTAAWITVGRSWMSLWWALITLVAITAGIMPAGPFAPSRLQLGIAEVRFSRRQYAEFDAAIDRYVTQRPALVLVRPDPDDRHIDYIINDPALSNEVLFGRLDGNDTDSQAIAADFPARAVYLYDVRESTLTLITGRSLPER